MPRGDGGVSTRFPKGFDPRRNTKGRPGHRVPTTMRALLLPTREENIKRLKELRDQGQDLKVAFAAAELLASYTDGQASKQSAPPEPKPAESGELTAAELAALAPPAEPDTRPDAQVISIAPQEPKP